MTDDDLSNVIEIRDPEIDAEAIMRQIRENIRRRRAEAEARGLDYEALALGLPDPGEATRLDRSLHLELRRLLAGSDKIRVGLSLTPSRIPLFAPIVQRARAALHQLVIYYVNMLAGQQARFNESATRVLVGLAKELEAGPTPAEVEALRQEVVALKRLLAAEAETKSG